MSEAQVICFRSAYRARHGHVPDSTLTKRQLASFLGKSTRWVELQVADGMPAGWDTRRHCRVFVLAEVEAWLAERAA